MKRTFVIALIGLLTTSSVSAQTGGWTSKVSPLLHQQVVEQQVAARRAASGETTETYVGALVKLAEGQNGSVLRREGTVLLDSLDGTYIALLPASRIPAMASGEQVVAMEAHERGKLHMDVTHVTTGANKVQAGSTVGDRTIPAYTGKGVVVGISDGGFDYTHPMFFDAQGNLRIKKVWDGYAANSNGYGGMGAIYTTQEAMVAAQGTMERWSTHATHVMGISAGSPWTAKTYGDAPVTYRGLAYEADIVAGTAMLATGNEDIDKVVEAKIKAFLYNTDYLKEVQARKVEINDVFSLLSMKIAFDYAQEKNMPCVVNCSWGTFQGFANHNEVIDEFIGKLLGPGRILVCSAGNEGDSYIYAEKPADEYEWSPQVTLETPTSAFQLHSDDEFELDMKIYNDNGGSPTLEYKLRSPIKSSEVRTEYDKDPDNAKVTWDWKDKKGKNHEIEMYYGYVKGMTSGNDYIFSLFFPEEYFKDELAYVTLTFRSNSGLKIVGNPDRILFGKKNTVNNPYTVGWPGTHPQAVTVGLVSHRNWVTNIAGESTYASGNSSDEGYLVNWSSCGPTLDGRMKPDVTTPGYNIISARSKLYSGNTKRWNDDNKLVVARGTYNNEEREVLMLSGTSMAAPVMTGIVALWLQAKPTLTRDEIIATLSRTCKKPDPKLTYPNNGYGYGEVDAYAGLLDILGVTTSIPTLPQTLAGVTLQGHTLRIEGITEPTTVNVYTLNGQRVFTTQTADGIVTLPNLPAAVYAVQCGSLGSSLIRL